MGILRTPLGGLPPIANRNGRENNKDWVTVQFGVGEDDFTALQHIHTLASTYSYVTYVVLREKVAGSQRYQTREMKRRPSDSQSASVACS
jgi:hypothetical protein